MVPIIIKPSRPSWKKNWIKKTRRWKQTNFRCLFMITSEAKTIINKSPKKINMNATTLDKMKAMKLFGMYRAFKTDLESGRTDIYTPDEITAHLIEAEWDERQNRSIEQKIRNARFRYKA